MYRTSEEQKKAFDLREKLAGEFLQPDKIPISFLYGDKRQKSLFWESKMEREMIDANITKIRFWSTDPDTGLEIRVEFEQYQDFPVLEWTAYLTNTGVNPTPIIADLQGLDAKFEIADPILQYSNGDAMGNESFEFFERSLTKEVFEMQPYGGRCCAKAFPYMRILSGEGEGMVLSVGWPGQWKTEMNYSDGFVHIRAGQAKTGFYLNPKEVVRTPRMTLVAFTGGKAEAVNIWRRWYLAHVLPKRDGEPVAPMLMVHGDRPTKEFPEFTACSQEMVEKALDAYDRQGVQYDAFWLDAGWYDCGTIWEHTGTWEEKKDNYPEGMLGVSKVCSAHDAKLILWFEPERVHDGTQIAKEHPEWLLRKEFTGCEPEASTQGPEDSLFNMGNPEAWEYITNLICDFLANNKIHWYRQDYNISPLKYWEENDLPERQGMTENQYIQGYLQFWDEILVRNPGIRIDACASGGQRNDLETLRRSVPLHYSDIGYGNHPVKMGFEQTMHEWIPYFKSHILHWDTKDGDYEDGNDELCLQVDKYDFYAELAPAITLMTVYSQEDSAFDVVRTMQGIWRKAAEIMLYSDFYPLTSYHKDAVGWWARQFDAPKYQEGFLHFVTGNKCTQSEQKVCPHLEENSTYCFKNMETGEQRILTGQEAMNGFVETLPSRSGSIWFYRKQG